MARINTGTMTVGIFAVLFGLVGAYALRAALVREEAPRPPAPKTVDVPLASYDIPAGRKITIGDMALMPMTQEDMLKRKLPLQTLMISSEQIVGRILRNPVKQGEPFLTTNVYPEGTGPDITERLKPGLRAFTLPIDDVSSAGGSVKVGSFVDVVFRTTPQPADRATRKPAIPQTTVTLLENIEVIDVARNEPAAGGGGAATQTDLRQSNKPGEKLGVRSVTLAVTLEQANMLKTAMGRGEFTLALRGQSDPDLKTMNQMTLEQLLGIKEPPPPFTTEVYRAGRRHTIQFDANGHVLDEAYGGWGATNYSFPQVGPHGVGIGISNKKDAEEDRQPAKDQGLEDRSTMVPLPMLRSLSPLYPAMPQYLPAALPAAGYMIPAL